MAELAAPLPRGELRRRRLILVATIIGSSMAFIDGTIVNIALPTIGRDLHAGLGAQQWIILSYSLAVVSLYIVSGALGDRYGRWRLFVAGVAGFAAASTLAAAAPSTAPLIAARVLQGVAGALLTTSSLGLLRATYGGDSGWAVGQWTAWSGIATVLGPPAGGLLVQYASWRWVFLVNLPGAVVALALAWAGRDREKLPERPRPLQPIGAAAIAVTFGALTYGLVEGGQAGFRTVWWVFLLALAGLALFVVDQRRSTHPMLPSALLRERVFVAANVYTLLVYAALSGVTFYLALYLQSGAVGYTPSRASLLFVPISLVIFVLAARFGRLADRNGPRRYLTTAPLVMSAGFVMLYPVISANPFVPLPGVLVLAVGLAMLVAPITSTALKAAPDEYAGLAAGVNTTCSRLGGLIATPLLGVVITLVFEATTTQHGVEPFAKHLTAGQQDATVTAFRAAIAVAVALAVGGAAVAHRYLPQTGRGEGTA